MNSRIRTSIRKGPRHPNVVEGPSKTIFKHCLLASSESISIHRRNVRFNLVLKELPKLPLELRSCSLL